MEPTFNITEEVSKDNYTSFVISPLPNGYGNTLGVSLRRVLLSSLPGAAIVRVRMAGVKHQFSTLKGMKEDVLDFLLNLKKVRISQKGADSAKLTLSAVKGIVTAADIKVPAGVTIANPELVLANLAKGAKLDVEMETEKGVGYKPAEEQGEQAVGVIALDATFSPVVRVNTKVEETRVGRVTNYDKLTLEIWTDGTIAPKDAMVESSKILVSYFNQVVTPKAKVETVKAEPAKDDLGSIGQLSVEEIGLPTRVGNALAKAGYETVEKLVNAPREDLMKVRNLGDKSLKIVKLALMEKGVKLENA